MQQTQFYFKKILVSYLCCYLVFSPLFVYGAPLVADGTTQTVIDKARNNVPVVQIADPNASGLSHNKFTHYNVNKSGLILNNAKTTTVKTQLGGFIYGNTQLTNNAKVILNEVTSTNRSALNGYTEVAGPRSDLVIANPNGLTINGAGFINTNNVTLTTGRPGIANGTLNSLNVTGGDILIDGAGLNTQGQLNTHIYTQYLKLNAKLHGQNLDLKLGNNTISYQSKAITASGAPGAPGTLLLDASALGGMYANRISLVGTDKGLGVNLPPEVLASAGDITITNDGNIALHKLSATQQINVQTANNITADNNVYSGTNVTLNAGNAVAINAGVTAAKNSVMINAAQLNNGATIIAGLNQNGTQNTTGTVAITSAGVTNSGQIQSTGNLNVSTNNLANSNSIIANNQSSINAKTSLTNTGSIHANNSNTINTGALTNSKNITATNQLAITTSQLTSTAGEISATNVNINAANLNSSATNILAVNNLNMAVTGAATNAGTMQAGKALNVTAATLNNQATMAGGAVGLSTTDITNSGNILSNTNLLINNANALLSSGGTIQATNLLDIKSTSFDNRAAMIAGNMVLKSAIGVNSGGIQSVNDLTATIDAFTNSGSVAAGNFVNLSSINSVTNTGSIHANNSNTINTGALTNSGNVTATNGLGITTGQLTSTAGEISATNVNINAANLNSSATHVLAVNNLNMAVTGSATNAGTMQAGKALNLTAATLNNQATMAGGAVGLSTTDITNSGNILSDTDLLINNGNALLSSAGTIQASNLLDIKSTSFDNRAAMIAGNMVLKSAIGVNSGGIQSVNDLTATIDAFTNSGSVAAGNFVNLSSINSVTNTGSIHANNSNTINTGALTNSKNITATNQLAITTGQLTSTAGELSGTNVNINAANLSSTATSVLAANDLTLNVTGSVTNAGATGRMQAGRNLLLQNAVSLSNQGLMAAGNNQSIGTSRSINNSGTLHANSALTLASTDVTNTKQISSDGTLNITAANGLNNANVNARIAALGNTNIQAAALDNSNGSMLTHANHTINVAGALVNTGGVIKSNQSSTIQTNSLNNSQGNIDAVQNLALTTKTANLTNSTLYAGNDATVTLDALDNIASSSIGAGRHLTVNAVNGITNRSDLLANGNVTLNTNGALLNQKNISSGGALLINANTLDNSPTATISGGTGISKLTIAGAINNQSRISAVGNLEASGTNITNNGFFNAGNDLTLNSTNLTNNTTLFAGRNMNLYTTGVLSNNPNANIFAMNNLVMAANAANGKTTSITNDQANIEAYLGNLNISAVNLTNRTNPPVIQGTYVPTSIVGGVNLSTNTVTKICPGTNCQNVVTTRVDSMLLKSSSAPATIQAGGNATLNVTNITNQYSLISAGGNIDLASKVVDNQPVDIVQVTTVSTAMYRNSRFCGGWGAWGLCIGGWKNRMVYVGTTTTPTVQINNTVASTIQAGGSITGHVANLTNGNIRKNQVIGATTVQSGNTTTTANATAATNTAINNNAGLFAVKAKTTKVGSSKTVSAAVIAKTAKVGNGRVAQPPVPVNTSIQIPTGNNGLFVVSQNPQSQYLIETNPAFTLYNNFISSGYMMQRINFSPDRTLKRVGDAFYENKLIRDSIFAQTGRRFLNKALNSDYAQYQYLMDNALKVHEDLQLIPGLTLTNAQIAMLHEDIVWLEEQMVAGQNVLVPVVYIANVRDYRLEGGKIIAGDDVDLVVTKLENSGLLQAGNDMNIDAKDSILNKDGSIRAGNNMSLLAKNDIENISATIKARNIILTSTDGSIINKRMRKDVVYQGGNYRDAKTLAGQAGNIEATESLALNAAKTIAITGSKLKAKTMALNAETVDITTTVKKADFFAGGGGNYIKEQSVKHLGSNIDADNLTINSSGTTTIEGSNVSAKENLNIHAKTIDILAVNDSSYSESKSSSKGFLSKKSTTTKKATSTNIASNVSGGNVTLSTINDLESTSAGDDSTGDDITGGDKVNGEAREGALGHINIIGSNVSAKERLALESAGDINVQAGFDGTMDETQTKKSGWFSGGKLFSKSEDLEGKLTKTAALSSLSGGDVSLNAKHDIAMVGVNISAKESLEGSAENITVENANNEEKTYSKHEKLSVGFGDALKSIVNPLGAVKVKDGKASVTLATAEYEKADKVTTKTTVVSSTLEAGNISLTAGSGEGLDDTRHSETDEGDEHGDEYGDDDLADDRDKSKGNINIKGSNLVAENDIDLTAENDVTIVEAKDTEKTASKEVKGKAELKVTVKNEYVQIAFAVKAAKEAKDNLQKARSSYSQYKRDLATQRGKLLKLKADFVNGKIGIEQVDIEEFEELIDDLKQDDAFYKANIALAAADLATKTLAVVTQMSTAASSSATYGFSASLELDIDVLEKKFEAYKERSVASNLVAENINITSGATTTVRGSQLNAKEEINIDSDELNILASQDINNSKESSDHKHLNISVGTSGATSASVSMDRSKGSSDGVTSTNSQLNANNINIVTEETTTIAGANVAANDELNIKTEHLNVASVQDSDNSRSQSSGFSLSGSMDGGISGAGVNAGNSRFRAKETVLTTLTGNSVNIDVEEDTTIRGALIAAVDKNGDDNGNLRLSTDTLEVGSLNNRRDSKSMSMGVDVGLSGDSVSSVGIDYSNDRSNSKTKTLGTIGNGTIEVGNVEKSNTKLLNRDINDNEIDIYNIESHRGLKGTVDTRVLTEKGRDKIAEEIMKSGMIVNTVKLIATNDKVGVEDFFSETDKSNKTYEAVKKKISEDPALAKTLQDSNLTPREKEEMLNDVIDAVMVKLGYELHDNKLIATDEKGRDGADVQGYHSEETGDSYVNDKNINGTKGLVAAAGHEAVRAMDNQDGINDSVSREDRASYAKNYGDNLANYTDMAMDINGYDDGMASSNNHVGNSSKHVQRNNQEFTSLNKNKGDNRQLHIKEINWISDNAKEFAAAHPGVSNAEAEKLLAQTAASMIDARWEGEEHIQKAVNSELGAAAKEFLTAKMDDGSSFDDTEGNTEHGYFAATEAERNDQRQYALGGTENLSDMGSSYVFNKKNVEDTIGLDNALDGAAHTAGAVVGVGEIVIDVAEGAKETYDILTNEEKRTQAINTINKMVEDGTLVDTVLNGMKEDAKQVLIDKVVADLYDDAYDEGKADVKIVLALAGAATGVGAVAGTTAKLALKTTDAIKDAITRQVVKQAAKKVDAPEAIPATRPVDSSHYSTAYEAKLPNDAFPGVSRQRHNQLGNQSLHEAFEADPEFAKQMDNLYPGIVDGVKPGSRGAFPRNAPTQNVTWHHSPETGKLELVPIDHHTAPGPVQGTLHPDGKGGFSDWGSN